MLRYRLYRLAAALLVLLIAGALWWTRQTPEQRRQRQLARAEQALAADDLADAEAVLQRLVQEEPDQFRPHYLYARVLRRRGWTRAAERSLERATQLGLPEADSRREFALLRADRDFTVAEPLLLVVNQERPDDVEVLMVLARGYAMRRDWGKAEQAYTRVLELRPEEPEARFERGRVRLEAKHFEKAEEDFRETVRRLPRDYPARLLLAHCLLTNARMAEAEPQLLVCRQLRPKAIEPLIGLATCAEERGDLDQAQNLLDQALTRDPNSKLALNEQGNLYLLQRRYQQAVGVFEQVVRLDPQDKQGHLKLAQALRKDGQPKRAQEHVRQFEALDREEEQKQRGPANPGHETPEPAARVR